MIESEDGRAEVSISTGVERSWSFGFLYYSSDHLVVEYWEPDTADYVEVLASDYTLTYGTGNAQDGFIGGLITYPKSPTAVLEAGWKVRVSLAIPFTQENIDLTNASGFDPRAVEKEFDLAVLRDQELRDGLAQTVRFPASVGEVPPLSGEDSGFLYVDDDGLLSLVTLTDGETVIPSWWTSHLSDRTDIRVTSGDMDAAVALAAAGGVYVGQRNLNPTGSTYGGTTPPTSQVQGPGSLIYGSITLDRFDPRYRPEKSTVLWNPVDMYSDPEGSVTVPASGVPYFNTLIGCGPVEGADVRRTTIVGAQAGGCLEYAERVDAFGVGAMRFARFAERCSAFGTLGQQWLGQAQANLAAMHHDLWWPTLPSNALWDVDGMETAVPGSRTAIIAVTDAVSSADTELNCSFGRDSLVHLNKGTANSGFGYRSLAHLYFGSSNASFGAYTLHNNLFGSNNVAVGHSAGYGHQSGDSNIYIGFEAGRTHYLGDRSIFIGRYAGQGWTAGDRNVIIGPFAGTSATPGSDYLIIANTEARKGLISGDFALGRVGVGGINPSEILAVSLHVRTSVSGVSSISTAANSLLLEGSNASGMTIGTPNDTNGRVAFADPESTGAGILLYDHSTDRMSIYTAASLRVQIWNGHFKFVTALPTSASGLESGEVWRNSNVLTFVP